MKDAETVVADTSKKVKLHWSVQSVSYMRSLASLSVLRRCCALGCSRSSTLPTTVKKD